MFVMTDKPSAATCAAALLAAVLLGVFAAVPFWNVPAVAETAAEGTIPR